MKIELDRPLGGHALGLERIGEAEAAHHEVGPRRTAAVELPVDVLALAEQRCPRGSSASSAARCCAMQIGRADLDEPHRQLARQEARQRHFELRIGEEEDALAGEFARGSARARARARSRAGARHVVEQRRVDAARRSAAACSHAWCLRRRAGRAQAAACAALLERARGVGQERLGQQKRRARARPAAGRRRGAAAGSGPARCRGSSNSRRNWSSTTSASAPTTSSDRSASGVSAGRSGTSEARQASSPWVKVVSMPLPE